LYILVAQEHKHVIKITNSELNSEFLLVVRHAIFNTFVRFTSALSFTFWIRRKFRDGRNT